MLIINGTLITNTSPNQILTDYALYIEDGKIKQIGPQNALLAWHPDAERLDAKGQYVMPGNICAHTHFYGAFARGMSIPGAPAKDFPEILAKLWWPLDRALDEETVRLSAQVLLIDAIRSGTTTLIDHHASPNFIDGSLDVIAGAVAEAGNRAVLCYEVTDRDGDARAQAGIRENERFLSRVQDGENVGGRIGALFGLHASLTLSPTTLDACRAANTTNAGFHIHVAEHEADEYDSLQKYGTRTVDHLYNHGILGPDTIVAHAVHTDTREASLLAETGTWVSHQPRSNMNNGVGVTPVESLLRAGVNVCLGTDGFPHAMWEEARFAYMLQKVHHRDPRRMAGDVVYDMLTTNNASLAAKHFPEATLGTLEEGAHADIIFVDYHPFTPLTAGNLPWQVIFGFHERMVTTTIVGGQILMLNRNLLTIDEERIAAQAREAAPALWERYEANVPS